MKLRYVILVLGIIFFNKINAESYRLSDDKKTIYVFEDCIIPLENFAPEGVHIYGNKDKGGVGYDGSDLFKKKTTNLNSNIQGISFYRDDDDVATMKIEYSKMIDNSIVYFYKAKWYNEWWPGEKFYINIEKRLSREEHSEEDHPSKENNKNGNDEGINDEDKKDDDKKEDNKEDSKEEKKDDSKKEKEEKSEDDDKKDTEVKSLVFNVFLILLYVVLLIATILVNYILYRRNKKILNEVSKKYLDLKEKVEQLDEDLKAKQNTSQKNKESILGSQDELKNFIKTYLLEFKQQQERNSNTQGNNTIGNTIVMVDSQEVKEQTIDTDDVKYNQQDNSFSLDQNDQKIFRIYSRNGDFYYTLVNDNEIRQELIGMIQIFEGCITYQTTNGEAKRVEPVNDGKLRRDGNKFYVDTNHKLTVKLV